MVTGTASKLSRGYTVYVNDKEQSRAWHEDFLFKTDAIAYALDQQADGYDCDVYLLHQPNSKVDWS